VAVYDGKVIRFWRYPTTASLGTVSGSKGDVIVEDYLLGSEPLCVRLRRNWATAENGIRVYDCGAGGDLKVPLQSVPLSENSRCGMVSGDLSTYGVLSEFGVQLYRWSGKQLVPLARWRLPQEFLSYRTSLLDRTGDRVWLGDGVFDSLSGNLRVRFDRSGTRNLFPKKGTAVWPRSDRIVEIALVRGAGTGVEEPRWDRSLLVWDAETGKRLATQFAPQANALAVSPDGRWILEAGQDRRVRFRDVETGEIRPEGVIRVHDGPVTSVAFHPSLPLFVTASEDFGVRVWSTETGSLVEDLGLFRRVPKDLLISPDGKRLGVSFQNTADLSFFAPKCFEPGEGGR
jgi:hypothetical protein